MNELVMMLAIMLESDEHDVVSDFLADHGEEGQDALEILVSMIQAAFYESSTYLDIMDPTDMWSAVIGADEVDPDIRHIWTLQSRLEKLVDDQRPPCYLKRHPDWDEDNYDRRLGAFQARNSFWLPF